MLLGNRIVVMYLGPSACTASDMIVCIAVSRKSAVILASTLDALHRACNQVTSIALLVVRCALSPVGQLDRF